MTAPFTTLAATRPVRFLSVGIAATLAHGIMLILLSTGAQLPPVQANSWSAIIAAAVSYFGHKLVTFNSGVPHRISVPRFLIQAVISWGVTTLLTAVLAPAIGIWSTSAVIMVLVPALNFTVYQRWVFPVTGYERTR